MEIDREIIHSPPSAVQRETYIIPFDPVVPTNPIALVDMSRDIAVKAFLGLTKSLGSRGTYKPLKAHPKREKRFSSYLSSLSHIIDFEPSFHGEETCEHIWKYFVTK
jgi:hypothetical protein